MKLSNAPSHTAPRMKVRYNGGHLQTHIYYTRSNHPGRGYHAPRNRFTESAVAIGGASKLSQLQEETVTIKRRMGLLHRAMMALRGLKTKKG